MRWSVASARDLGLSFITSKLRSWSGIPFRKCWIASCVKVSVPSMSGYALVIMAWTFDAKSCRVSVELFCRLAKVARCVCAGT